MGSAPDCHSPSQNLCISQRRAMGLCESKHCTTTSSSRTQAGTPSHVNTPNRHIACCPVVSTPVLIGGEVVVADDAVEPAAVLRPEALHLVPHQRVKLQRGARGRPRRAPPLPAAARACHASAAAGRRRPTRRGVPIWRVPFQSFPARLAAAAVSPHTISIVCQNIFLGTE